MAMSYEPLCSVLWKQIIIVLTNPVWKIFYKCKHGDSAKLCGYVRKI